MEEVALAMLLDSGCEHSGPEPEEDPGSGLTEELDSDYDWLSTLALTHDTICDSRCLS